MNHLLVGLYLNDKLISASWSLLHRDCLYYIFPGIINQSLRKYSTGRIILEELINLAFDKGIRTIDYTLGDENYKFKWAGNLNRLESYAKINSTKGNLYFFLLMSINKLKKNTILIGFYRKILNYFKNNFKKLLKIFA